MQRSLTQVSKFKFVIGFKNINTTVYFLLEKREADKSMRKIITAAVAAGALLATSAVSAQTPSFFRIVSGSAGGNYFPMAGLLANAI